MYSSCPQYKQKGFAQLLLILLVVILLFGAFYFYFVSTGNNTLQLQRSVINNIKNKTQPEFTDYNSPLGFQLKYAKDLTVKEDSEAEYNKRGNGDFRKNFRGYVQYEPGQFIGALVVLDKTNNYDTNPFTVWVFDNPNDLSIDKWYANYWYYPFVWGDFTYVGKSELAPKQDATVSGQIGKSGVIDYQPGKPTFVYLSKDKKMYLFRVINGQGNIGYQILSTFKFTGNKAEPSASLLPQYTKNNEDLTPEEQKKIFP